MNLRDKLDDWASKHDLFVCILISMIVITCVGLAIILPMIFAIVFSLWWLISYLPIIGFFVGIAIYFEIN